LIWNNQLIFSAFIRKPTDTIRRPSHSSIRDALTIRNISCISFFSRNSKNISSSRYSDTFPIWRNSWRLNIFFNFTPVRSSPGKSPITLIVNLTGLFESRANV
jgi:hypothetical protein